MQIAVVSGQKHNNAVYRRRLVLREVQAGPGPDSEQQFECCYNPVPCLIDLAPRPGLSVHWLFGL